MITLFNLNTERDLAARTFLFYSDKMINYLLLGSDKFSIWYKDSMQLEILSKALLYLYIDSDKLYLGDTEVSLTYYKLLLNKVREYYLYEVDSIYPEGSIIDPENPNLPDGPIVPPTVIPYLADWRSTTITISQDATTAIPLPFIWNNIDPESFTLTVHDAASGTGNSLDVSSGAYYIQDNTIYWQYYFDLNAGDKVFLRWFQIKGL